MNFRIKIYQLLSFRVFSLGLLTFPSFVSLAQKTDDPAQTVNLGAIVYAKDENNKMNTVCVAVSDVDIWLYLSDGNSLHMVSSDERPVIFKGLTPGCEYVAEVSGAGYTTTIYHGRIPDKQSHWPLEFYECKTDAASSSQRIPFKDSGRADVEGFVTCPTSFQWVTEPLPDAVVFYTSSADSLYTTTDQHGYFRFDEVKDREGKVYVSHMTCKSVEAVVPPEDDSRWLWLITEEDLFKLAASKISSSMPVISIVGDTVRYNVAATQKVMHGDRLADVLERLPGMTMENGIVKVLGKPLSEILINNTDLFGRSQHDALSYLAGVQVNKIDVYETNDERNPQSDKRKLVMNVKTKRLLKNVTDIDVSAAGGGNMPLSPGSLMPPERWQAGLGARYFSVPLITTLDLGTNNLGLESGSDLSRIPGTMMGGSSLVMPTYASVKLRKALEMNKEKTWASQTIDFNYSFKKREENNKKEIERSYNSDDAWIDRMYESCHQSSVNNLTHGGELRWDSQKKWRPHASIAYSRNESGRRAELSSIDETRLSELDVNIVSLHQISQLNSRNYKIDGAAGVSYSQIPNHEISFNMSFSGGEGDGSEIRCDSTSTQQSWITSDEGNNRHFSSNASVRRRMGENSVTFTYAFNYDYGLQRKLSYDEVVDEAHLSPLRSEDSRSNIYRHSLEANYLSGNFRTTLGFQTSCVLDTRKLPYAENVNKSFPAPVFRIEWNSDGSFYNRFSMRFYTQSKAPNLNELGSVFHDTNPLFVNRGNPNLKQRHFLCFEAQGKNMISGGMLDFTTNFTYMVNDIIATRTYYSEKTILDGYTFPAGATFSTYSNFTGGMRWNNSVNYSVSVQPLRYKIDASAGYLFAKNPSCINGKFEYYLLHNPSLRVEAKSFFSPRFKLDFSAVESMNQTDSQSYGTTWYRTFSASVSSDNRITEWFFVRAGYRHSARIPMSGSVVRIDTDMLNASTGVYLMGARLRIALVFKDILNNMPSISMSVHPDYLEKVRTTNMNRYVLLNIRYVFNSSEK